jgi:hypothetical protein
MPDLQGWTPQGKQAFQANFVTASRTLNVDQEMWSFSGRNGRRL